MLPSLNVGDILIIHDAGGYTFSMYSRYNSRPAPPIYGHDNKSGLFLIKKGESIEDSLKMWGDDVWESNIYIYITSRLLILIYNF